MKLTAAQIQQTSSQLEAKPVPEDSRMAPDLKKWFGDHTFFLGSAGLHFLEPAATENGAEAGRLVKVARWTDAQKTALAPHEPEPTEVLIPLDEAA